MKLHKKFEFRFPLTEQKNNGHLSQYHIGDLHCKGHTEMPVFHSEIMNRIVPRSPIVVDVIFDHINLHDVDIQKTIDSETLELIKEAAKNQFRIFAKKKGITNY